jgi:cytoskeletal protein RodZ
MKEFFENLKQIRESKGISLEEISRRSRLPLKYLQDIEQGKLENLPAGYDRIFLKRYLKEIQEDKEEVWRDFNLFFGSGPLQSNVPYSSDIPEKKPKLPVVEEEPDVKQSERKSPNAFKKLLSKWNLEKSYRFFWIFFTVLILAVVIFFAYQQYLFVKNKTPEIEEISVTEYIREMQERDSLLTPQANSNPEAKAASGENFTIELRAIHRTWIREIRDQHDTSEYILNQGLKRKISARESVKFMMGRADGVKIWLNADSLGVLGKAEEVVISLLLNQKGIVEKRLKKLQPKKTPLLDSSQVNQLSPQSVQNFRFRSGMNE